VKTRTVLLFVVMLPLIVLISCAASEMAWINKEDSQSSFHKVLGLPSITVGNLNPASRNPSLELFCTGIYDVPGGYCGYYSSGVPFDDFKFLANITLSGSDR
jgi:hypothetical protein